VKAAQIAIDEANAATGGPPKFELLVEDDQYDTAKAVSAYSKLVAAGAVAIVASTYGGVFATADRAVKDEVVVVNPLDCNDDIAKLSENTFCIATQSESAGRVISDDIQTKSLGPVGIIYDEKNPFMTLVANVVKKSDLDVAYSSGIDSLMADFKTELLRAKSKNIRALVLLGHDPMGKAMRQGRELGIDAQFYTVGTITSPGYQQLAGAAANGALVAYWEAPRTRSHEAFLATFIAKVGRPPILDLATIPTYDTVRILTASLQSDAATSMKLKQSLLGLLNYPGLSGPITMDRDGAVRSIHETIYEFNAGKLERVFDGSSGCRGTCSCT
jgi:branched-chain amino acid transport system substrate-binding protein